MLLPWDKMPAWVVRGRVIPWWMGGELDCRGFIDQHTRFLHQLHLEMEAFEDDDALEELVRVQLDRLHKAPPYISAVVRPTRQNEAEDKKDEKYEKDEKDKRDEDNDDKQDNNNNNNNNTMISTLAELRALVRERDDLAVGRTTRATSQRRQVIVQRLQQLSEVLADDVLFERIVGGGLRGGSECAPFHVKLEQDEKQDSETAAPAHLAVINMRPILLDLSQRTVYGAGDSIYYSQAINSNILTQLTDLIKAELEPMYIPREKITVTMFGRNIQLPRDQAFLSDSHQHIRSYGGEAGLTRRWTPITLALRDALCAGLGQQSTHLVVNRYHNGSDYIGYHHDDMSDASANTAVLTISLGASRLFKLREVSTGRMETVVMQAGSVFVLGPRTNQLWKHCITKTAQVVGQRISLTYRAVQAAPTDTSTQASEDEPSALTGERQTGFPINIRPGDVETIAEQEAKVADEPTITCPSQLDDVPVPTPVAQSAEQAELHPSDNASTAHIQHLNHVVLPPMQPSARAKRHCSGATKQGARCSSTVSSRSACGRYCWRHYGVGDRLHAVIQQRADTSRLDTLIPPFTVAVNHHEVFRDAVAVAKALGFIFGPKELDTIDAVERDGWDNGWRLVLSLSPEDEVFVLLYRHDETEDASAESWNVRTAGRHGVDDWSIMAVDHFLTTMARHPTTGGQHMLTSIGADYPSFCLSVATWLAPWAVARSVTRSFGHFDMALKNVVDMVCSSSVPCWPAPSYVRYECHHLGVDNTFLGAFKMRVMQPGADGVLEAHEWVFRVAVIEGRCVVAQHHEVRVG